MASSVTPIRFATINQVLSLDSSLSDELNGQTYINSSATETQIQT